MFRLGATFPARHGALCRLEQLGKFALRHPLRHADGFAVRLKGVSTSEPAAPARKK